MEMLRSLISAAPPSISKGKSFASLRHPEGGTTTDSNRFFDEVVLVTLKPRVRSLPGVVSMRLPVVACTVTERDWNAAARWPTITRAKMTKKNIRRGDTGCMYIGRITCFLKTSVCIRHHRHLHLRHPPPRALCRSRV